MKLLKLLALALAFSFIAPALHAEDVAYFYDYLTSDNPTQNGRLSRNGIPQDWLGSEPFPGVINSSATYSYATYYFPASDFYGAPYIEISFYDYYEAYGLVNGSGLFSSAYSTSYDPTSLSTNWLGDQGSSGNYFGIDARYYDVYLDNAPLVLVVNSANASGLNDPYIIDISAYADSSYGEPALTPEPSSLVLLTSGIAGVVGLYRRRRNAAQSV
jgi:hypothetical protein